jgi:uncharacterized protein YprB with RNaseH-like and TPR domain
MSAPVVFMDTETTGLALTDDIATITDQAELRTLWQASGPERREQITARVAELKALADDGDPMFGGES